MAKPERRIALVTGASSGIGDATAERLATSGYKVYGTSRRRAQAGQRSFEMLTLDVTSDASVEAVVSEVVRLEGRIDLLVNNAGFSTAPANTKTQFDANLLQPDSTLDEYRDVRAAVGKRMTELVGEGDEPAVVAQTVLTAAMSPHPKLRYAVGGRASRLRWLHRFAPAGLMDAGIRRNLRLDVLTASRPRSAVPAKP